MISMIDCHEKVGRSSHGFKDQSLGWKWGVGTVGTSKFWTPRQKNDQHVKLWFHPWDGKTAKSGWVWLEGSRMKNSYAMGILCLGT